MLGVRTEGATQLIFVDTPGMHLGQSKAINQAMNQAAATALSGVDAILFLCDRAKWTDEDAFALDLVSRQKHPVLLVINKNRPDGRTGRPVALCSATVGTGVHLRLCSPFLL